MTPHGKSGARCLRPGARQNDAGPWASPSSQPAAPSAEGRKYGRISHYDQKSVAAWGGCSICPQFFDNPAALCRFPARRGSCKRSTVQAPSVLPQRAMADKNHILTLSCEDRPRIVATVTGRLADFGGNIAESSQFWDRTTNRFFCASISRHPRRSRPRPSARPWGRLSPCSACSSTT